MRTYYVGMDVHQASIVIAVTNVAGKVVMESIIETKAQTVLGFQETISGTINISIPLLHNLVITTKPAI